VSRGACGSSRGWRRALGPSVPRLSEDPEVSVRVHGRRAATTTRSTGGVLWVWVQMRFRRGRDSHGFVLRIGQKSRGEID
jgi:hypothetical protein